MSHTVLIVDDSAFMRMTISKIIQTNTNFTVVGTARNGLDAIDKIKKFHPDVVTMDVEMPEMDGVTAVRRIMQECPVPILMLSSLTGVGTHVTIQALEAGAVDCLLKDSILALAKQENEKVRSDFYARLEAAVSANVNATYAPHEEYIATSSMPPHEVEAVIIGCSTGGPAALQQILPRLPKDLSVPVIVVQHMPVGFTKSLANRFNSVCDVHVKEAEDGDILQAGNVYIAPAGTQTVLEREQSGVVLRLTDETPIETRFHPSVDVTVLSAAPLYRDKLLVAVLTGMGHDGALGCERVKTLHGHVAIQSKESCVVYGMPRAVAEAGCADAILPLEKIAAYILQYVG